jgi:hypothetical protein
VSFNERACQTHCQKTLERQELVIVDELGFVPMSKTGAEMTP